MFSRNFVLLWQGQMISAVGSQMFGLALLYWMLETTGSATMIGLMLMAAALPAALLGPFGGVLADALSRKLLIVSADAVRGVVTIGFVVVLWLGEQRWWLPSLFIAQVLIGACNAVFSPSLRASIPDLVPPARLASANSLLQGTSAVMSTLGLAAGGFLYAFAGALYIFLFNGLSFLAAAVTTAFVALPEPPARAASTSTRALSTFRRDTLEGLMFVRDRSGLPVTLLVMSVLNCMLVPTGLALPILVRDDLLRGPEFLGVLGACQGAGTVVGFALAGTFRIPARHRVAVVWAGISTMGLFVAGLGVNRVPELSLALVAAFGAVLPLVNVNIITVIQGATPSAVRGRVLGLVTTLTLGLIPIAQGLSGLLIDAVDKQVAMIYVAVGLLMPLFIFMACSRQSFRKFMSSELGG